jgi:hypothetical protein
MNGRAQPVGTVIAHTNVTNVSKDFGADNTGTVDATLAFQNALNTGSNVYVPPGTYRISETITFQEGGQALYGDSARTCILKSYVADGSATIDGNDFSRIEIRNLAVYGDDETTPYQNTTGIDFYDTDANSEGCPRSSCQNVEVRYCAKGIRFSQSWILFAPNCWARDCDIGLHIDETNNIDGSFRLSSNGQPFLIDGCYSARMDMLVDGTIPTTSSTIDDAQGLTFSSLYSEHSTTPTISEIVIGGTTVCTGLRFDAVNASRGNAEVVLFEFDDVDGVFLGNGQHAGGTAGVVFSETADSKNITSLLLPPDASQGQMLPPPTLMNRPIYNYFPDPYFAAATPVWDVQQDCTASADTTTVPEGMRRSVAMAINGDGAFAFVEENFDLTAAPYDELLGQEIGIAAMIRAPDNANHGTDTAGPGVWMSVNGTGGTSTTTRNRDYVPDEWVLAWHSLDIPSDATNLECRFYANNSSTDKSGDTVHLGACFIWLGGSKNYLKLYRGDLIPRTP